MPPVQLITDDRAAWVSLPLLGTAYASRCPTLDFGCALETGRSPSAGEHSATLWAGPWEVTADSSRRRGLIPAFVLLMAMVLLKAMVWPNSRADRSR